MFNGNSIISPSFSLLFISRFLLEIFHRFSEQHPKKCYIIRKYKRISYFSFVHVCMFNGNYNHFSILSNQLQTIDPIGAWNFPVLIGKLHFHLRIIMHLCTFFFCTIKADSKVDYVRPPNTKTIRSLSAHCSYRNT